MTPSGILLYAAIAVGGTLLVATSPSRVAGDWRLAHPSGGPAAAAGVPSCHLARSRRRRRARHGGRGRLWRVKWGNEVRAENVAVRLAWACGYFAETTYFIFARALAERIAQVGRAGGAV